MQRYYSKIVLCLILVIFSGHLSAQTFHALFFVDKNDPKIGRGCDADYYAMSSFLNTVAQSIGYQFVAHDASGIDFHANTISQKVNSLSANPDDIIFCYFSSHGENRGEKFPCANVGGACMSVAKIHQDLKSKNARLCIIDCCNVAPLNKKIINKGLEVIEDIPQDENRAYHELFLKTKGDIIMTSSKQGQYSYTDSDAGSYFTNKFRESILTAVNFSSTITWKAILADTKQRLKNEAMTEGRQIPYYEINLGDNRRDEPEPNPAPEVADINDFLNQLCDQSKSFSERNDLMNAKKADFFTHDAYVGIYIGSTLVDEASLDLYLSKLLASSELIQNINLIEKISKLGSSKSKYSIIYVQEVRK